MLTILHPVVVVDSHRVPLKERKYLFLSLGLHCSSISTGKLARNGLKVASYVTILTHIELMAQTWALTAALHWGRVLQTCCKAFVWALSTRATNPTCTMLSYQCGTGLVPVENCLAVAWTNGWQRGEWGHGRRQGGGVLRQGVEAFQQKRSGVVEGQDQRSLAQLDPDLWCQASQPDIDALDSTTA